MTPMISTSASALLMSSGKSLEKITVHWSGSDLSHRHPSFRISFAFELISRSGVLMKLTAV